MLSVQPSSPGQKSGCEAVLPGWLLQPHFKGPTSVISHSELQLLRLWSEHSICNQCVILKYSSSLCTIPHTRTQRMIGLSPVLNSYIQTLLKSKGDASLTNQTCPWVFWGQQGPGWADTGTMDAWGEECGPCPHSSLSVKERGLLTAI